MRRKALLLFFIVAIFAVVISSVWASAGQELLGGITSLNGLTDKTQTFANDTNVTISSSGTTHTLGWSGVIASSRTAASVASSTVLTTDGTTNRWYTGISLDKLTITGTGTSTALTGALSSAGLASSNGLTLTGNSLLQTNSATNTFSNGIVLLGQGGLFSSNGLTLTGGNISTASSNLTIQPGGNNHILLNPSSTGNVGIGTTNPQSLLSVLKNASGGQVALYNSMSSNLSYSEIKNQASPTDTSYSAGIRFLREATGANFGSSIGFLTETDNGSSDDYNYAVYIKNRNVGIGTTGPGVPLEIVKSTAGAQDLLTLDNSSTGNGVGVTTGLRFRNVSNQMADIYTERDTNLLSIQNLQASSIRFLSNTTLGSGEVVRILNNGNVGIGTTSPGASLAVQTSSAIPPLSIATTTSKMAVLVDANGKMGLGTTTAVTTLDINGSAAIKERYLGSGTAFTIDNSANQYAFTLTGATTITMAVPTNAGQKFTIIAAQDSTGGRVISSWGSNVFWFDKSGTATTSPSMSTKPYTFNIFSCTTTGAASTTMIYLCSNGFTY